MGRLYLLLALVFLYSSLAVGQMNYRKGYVVTQDQDTLVGLIKDCGLSKNAKSCTFRASAKHAPVKYSPSDLKGYGMYEYKRYVSRPIFSKKVFAQRFIEVLFEGNINLYYNYKGNDVKFYAEKEGGHLTGLVNRTIVIPKPQGLHASDVVMWRNIEFEDKVYIDTLKAMLKDEEEIVSQLNELEYKPKSLISVFKDYTKRNCAHSKCIRYEKDRRVGRDRFGLFSGVEVFNYELSAYNFQSNFFATAPVGMLVNIPFSTLNERFSLQGELSYTNYNYSSTFANNRYLNVKSEKVSLPVSLRYKFAARKFSPVIGLGKSFGLTFNSKVRTNLIENEFDEIIDALIHRYNQGAWFIDLGAEYDFKPNLTLFSTLRLYRYNSKIVEEENSNHFNFKNAEGIKFKTNTIALMVGVKF